MYLPGRVVPIRDDLRINSRDLLEKFTAGIRMYAVVSAPEVKAIGLALSFVQESRNGSDAFVGRTYREYFKINSRDILKEFTAGIQIYARRAHHGHGDVAGAAVHLRLPRPRPCTGGLWPLDGRHHHQRRLEPVPLGLHRLIYCRINSRDYRNSQLQQGSLCITQRSRQGRRGHSTAA